MFDFNCIAMHGVYTPLAKRIKPDARKTAAKPYDHDQATSHEPIHTGLPDLYDLKVDGQVAEQGDDRRP